MNRTIKNLHPCHCHWEGNLIMWSHWPPHTNDAEVRESKNSRTVIKTAAWKEGKSIKMFHYRVQIGWVEMKRPNQTWYGRPWLGSSMLFYFIFSFKVWSKHVGYRVDLSSHGILPVQTLSKLIITQWGGRENSRRKFKFCRHLKIITKNWHFLCLKAGLWFWSM